MSVELGNRLRRLRRERRITLQALARDLGVHFTTVSAWERGRSEPDLEALGRLAGRLDVTLAALLGGPEAARPRLRLEVWSRGRWDDFAARTEAAQLAAALLRQGAGGAPQPRLLETLLHGRPAVADLLQLGSRYDVEAIEKPSTGGRGHASPDGDSLERRLRALPDPLRPVVEGLLGEWLDLFSAPEEPREARGANGRREPPARGPSSQPFFRNSRTTR